MCCILNFWMLGENNTGIKSWRSFQNIRKGRKKPKAKDGWSGSLTFIQVCVNSLLTLQGGFQMSGHDYGTRWVTCCRPRRTKWCLFRGIRLEQTASPGHCSHLIPPLWAMQVQFPQPMPGPEMPPSCANTAMRFTAGLVGDTAVAGGAMNLPRHVACWIDRVEKRVHEKREGELL